MYDSQDCRPAASQFHNQHEQTLTCREAASFLASSPRTLEGWRLKGKGPAYIRQGRSIRYRLADLIEFQETNKVMPLPDNSCQHLGKLEARQ